ncbi:MAG: 2'-deoxycytidine 5'-triphosphate deaminase [Candidatus Woesearchaeota archaeon]|nr:MAG: 2'-deoxycytidine 5'-triphosphate deaminase [Candidatus Woesearchaeota archaeon]
MVTDNGVLPRQELKRLIRAKIITSSGRIDDSQLQPSSLDLTLGDEVFRLRAGFLPREGESIGEAVAELEKYKFPLKDDETNVLEPGATYLIRLRERLKLPKGFVGKANPKSTTGRWDVFTRLLVDGHRSFDTIPEAYEGPIWIEVHPLTYNIKIRKGVALNQLRIVHGESRIPQGDLRILHEENPLVFDTDGKPMPSSKVRFDDDGILLTLDLDATIAAYEALINTENVDIGAPRGSLRKSREDFFRAIRKPKKGLLFLNPGSFYLLATRERVSIPPGVCGTMVAYDPASAEGRVHYAGFFDPGFGYGKKGEVRGTPATLEVRVLTPFRVVDGQPLCRMTFEKMRSNPDILYRGNYRRRRGPELPKQLLVA